MTSVLLEFRVRRASAGGASLLDAPEPSGENSARLPVFSMWIPWNDAIEPSVFVKSLTKELCRSGIIPVGDLELDLKARIAEARIIHALPSEGDDDGRDDEPVEEAEEAEEGERIHKAKRDDDGDEQQVVSRYAVTSRSRRSSRGTSFFDDNDDKKDDDDNHYNFSPLASTSSTLSASARRSTSSPSPRGRKRSRRNGSPTDEEEEEEEEEEATNDDGSYLTSKSPRSSFSTAEAGASGKLENGIAPRSHTGQRGKKACGTCGEICGARKLRCDSCLTFFKPRSWGV